MKVDDRFQYANNRSTNAEVSFIRENTVKDLGLQYKDKIVQIMWKDLNSAPENTTQGTVLILVSEEEAATVGMNVDILFGKHFKKDLDVQLQAVRASMDTFTESSSLLPKV